MPEIGECYSIAEKLKPHVGEISAVSYSSKFHKNIFLDKKQDIKFLKGSKINKIAPYGKSIWFFGEKGKEKFIMTSQLGMTGSWFINDAMKNRGHVHLSLKIKNDTLFYSDPRMFGKIMIFNGSSYQDITNIIMDKKKWGIDPILSEPKEIEKRLYVLSKKTGEIKARLLEQNLIFGIGNYLASEILFDAHISPHRKVRNLSESDMITLAKSIKKLCILALKHGGFSFAGGYILPDGSLGNLWTKIKIYQKDGITCPNCKAGKIKKEFILGRATYFCNKCQK